MKLLFSDLQIDIQFEGMRRKIIDDWWRKRKAEVKAAPRAQDEAEEELRTDE